MFEKLRGKTVATYKHEAHFSGKRHITLLK